MTKTLPFVKIFIGKYFSGTGREYWEEALAVGAPLGLGSDLQSSSEDSAGGESEWSGPPARPGGASGSRGSGGGWKRSRPRPQRGVTWGWGGAKGPAEFGRAWEGPGAVRSVKSREWMGRG